MKRRIKKALFAILYRMGYTITANKRQVYNPETMEAALQRIKTHGISPATVIDVGAAEGSWSAFVMSLWPQANYQLIEPLEEHRELLELFRKKHPNADFHLAVAGEEPSEVALNISDDLHGSGVYGADENSRKVRVLTLDEVSEGQKGPFLIKLDTHGYELPILKGARETLEKTEALIIEVYGFHISPTCLLFHELSGYLYQQGFRLADIVEVARRPADKMFWQADAIYYRKDHPFFANNNYA